MKQAINPQAILYLIVFLLIISCGYEKKNQNEKEKRIVEEIDIRQLPVRNLFSFKRPIDNCRFVALETTDESLIGEIDKVSVEGNLIFIKDNNDKLLVFDIYGKFLNKIGRIGQSREELLSFVDFYVNKNNGYVGILDIMRSRMVRYTLDGKYISSHDCAKEMNEAYNIIGVMGDDLLIGMSNHKNSKYAYISVSKKDYSLTGSYLPYNVVGNIPCIPLRSVAGYAADGFFMTINFSDTIYKFIDNNIPEPILMVKSEQKVINSKVLSDLNGMNLEIDADAGPILKNKGFSVGISRIFVTDAYLNIAYPLPNYNSVNMFYCLETGKTYKSNTKKSDFFGQSWKGALTTTEDEIVYSIEADRAIELKDKTDLFVNKEVLETIKDVEEFDNPVLVFFSSGYESGDEK